MAKENLCDLIREVFEGTGIMMCFCGLCNHDRAYGYCYACDCHNNQPRPAVDAREAEKMLAAIRHWRGVATDFAKGYPVNFENAPQNGTSS